MHQQLSKQAGIKANSFDDLVVKLKGIQDQGKNFRTHTDPEELARNIMYERGGSGSIFVDAANGLLNTVSGKKRLGDKIKRKISDGQRELTNLDIKAGAKIDDTLSKHKATRKLSEAFVYDHKVPLVKSKDGTANEIVELSVPALTAPIEKAKKVALPLAGAMYINSKISDATNNQMNEGGDVVNRGTMSESEYREHLKGKIASALGMEVEKTASAPKANTEDTLLLKASTMLKTAAQKQKQMESDMVSLAMENKKLDHEICMRKKADEAKEVVDVMLYKGLIKRADAEDKIDELIEMDKKAFEMFRDAINNIQPEEKIASGIDDLTFLAIGNTIETRRTLADSLEDAAMEINK